MPPGKVTRDRDGLESVDLLKYAVDHRRAAELLFAAEFRLFDSAAYLAHLAVETLLKACLLELLGEFPKSHDLLNLRKRCTDAGVVFQLDKSAEQAFASIASFAEIRYPSPKEPRPIGTSTSIAFPVLWNLLADGIPPSLSAAYASSPANLKGNRVLMIRAASEGRSVPPIQRKDDE